MSGFAPGDEVVCVDDAPHREWSINKHRSGSVDVTAGQRYVVRWAGEYAGIMCVRLVGVDRRNSKRPPTEDTPLAAARFALVRRDSIEALKQYAAKIGKTNKTPVASHGLPHAHSDRQLAGPIAGPSYSASAAPAGQGAAGVPHPWGVAAPAHSVDGRS